MRISKIVRDKNGKIVVFQKPNLLIIGWALADVLAHFIKDPTVHNGLSRLAQSLLFAWAYLELVKGVNWFRRGLGFVILCVLIYGFF